MASLEEFSRRMRIRAEQVSGNTTALVRRTALAVDQALVMGTPVDTGRARSNWVAQIGVRFDGVIDAYSPGEAGSTAGQNEQAAMDQAERVIRQYQSGFDRTIYITNNLPYIQRLNEGWSAQAPAMFVEMAVQEAVRVINSGRILGP